MNNIQLQVRFPDEYFQYDDIESLWHYSIENSKNITVEFADLGFELNNTNESIISGFCKIFEDMDKTNILYKWIADILIECEKYYIENIQPMNGEDFFIFHSLIQFRVIQNGETVIEIEKPTDELLDDCSAEEIVSNYRTPSNISSESSEMSPDNILLIKNVLEKELNLNGELSFFSFENLYKENGFEIIESPQDGHLRFEIKIDNTYLAIASSDVAPREIEFIVSSFSGYKISGNW